MTLLCQITSRSRFIAAKFRFTTPRQDMTTLRYAFSPRSQGLQDCRRASIKPYTKERLHFSWLFRRLPRLGKAVTINAKTPVQALSPPSSHGGGRRFESGRAHWFLGVLDGIEGSGELFDHELIWTLLSTNLSNLSNLSKCGTTKNP